MRGMLKIVAAGDFHFGNPKINAEALYMKLKKYFYPELMDAELCFLTGDIYDQLLTVNSKAYKYAALFILDLMKISSDTGMQIRVLHGTYTHDRDQLSVFNIFKYPNSRIKIINEITAEEISDIRCGMDEIHQNIRVAYLPDNLPYKESSDAIAHLERNLTVLGWQSVDLLIGHGSFSHVIPADSSHRPPCLYSAEQFEHIVHGPIVMGHIHTSGRYRNIIYCGSYDRMAHNEEEPKGFYVVTKDINGNTGWKNRFVKNEEATLFISIQPEGSDQGLIARDFLNKMSEKFPDEVGNVRVLHESPEVRSLLHRVCSNNYPNVIYTSKSIGEKSVNKLQVSEIGLDIFDDVKPDIHNLGNLVWKFLEDRHLTEVIKEERIVNLVKELIAS